MSLGDRLCRSQLEYLTKEIRLGLFARQASVERLCNTGGGVTALSLPHRPYALEKRQGRCCAPPAGFGP